MTDQRPNRRRVLKGAGAVAATAALLSPTTALAKTTSATTSIVGSWLSTATTSGTPSLTIKVLATFDQAGGMVETEQGDEVPAAPLSLLASPGHGAWVSGTGPNTYAFHFTKLLYDTSGNLAGFEKNSGTSTVAGDTFTGSGTFVVTDPTGKVLATTNYKIAGTRITVGVGRK